MVGNERDVGYIDGYAQQVIFEGCNRNGIVEICRGIIVDGENVFFGAVDDGGVTVKYGVNNGGFVDGLELGFEGGR